LIISATRELDTTDTRKLVAATKLEGELCPLLAVIRRAEASFDEVEAAEIEAVIGGASPGVLTADARQKLEQDKARAEILRKACDEARRRARDIGERLEFLAFNIDDAIRNLIWASPEGRALVRREWQLQNSLTEIERAMSASKANGTNWDQRCAPGADFKPDFTLAAEWQKAVAALKSDADAQLPTLPEG
jgi:hypothetical protein